MVVQRRCYVSVQWAAVAVQAWTRARAQRVRLRVQRAAADQIAAAWRGKAARAQFGAVQRAVIAVQAAQRARVSGTSALATLHRISAPAVRN